MSGASSSHADTSADTVQSLWTVYQAQQEQIQQLTQQVSQTTAAQQHLSMQLRPSSSSSSSSPVHLIPSKPTTFSGAVGESATLWLTQLNAYFSAIGAGGSSRTLFAVAQLRDNALLWYTSIPELRDAAAVDYDRFQVLLLARYNPVSNGTQARADLRRLKYTGSINAYVSSFQAIMQRITDMSEADKLDYFTVGLNQKLRSEIIRHGVTTLQDAINMAVRFHSLDALADYQYNTTSMSSPPSSNSSADPMQLDNITDFEQGGEELNATYMRNNNNNSNTFYRGRYNGVNNRTLDGRNNNNNNNNNDARMTHYTNNGHNRPKCYNCGRFGHVRSQCRLTPLVSQPSHNRYRGATNYSDNTLSKNEYSQRRH